MELAKARDVAREWLEQIGKGLDPRLVEEAEAAEAQQSTFDRIAEIYIAERLDGKKREDIARAIRREFGGQVDGKPIGPWAGKPIAGIKTKHVAEVIVAKAKTAPTQARNCLSHLSRMMRWAVARGLIEYSPAAQIRPGDLLGKVQKRTRHLSNEELVRVWETAQAWPYPWGPIYLLLILTGMRLNEVADARWSEIDMRRAIWTVPAERMKGKLDHVVPILPMIADVLRRLPRWNGGEFLFSNSNGEDPVTVSNDVKARMDAAACVYNWRNHDIRRTMRSHLSAIRQIEEHVRELMIAHKRKGIEGTYDCFQYLEEKRLGFELWHARLSAVLNGQGANVVQLQLAG